MDDAFKIYVEQLRKGQVEKLDETFPSDFLDVHEQELKFPGPVKLKGEAYLANEDLVLHFDVSYRVELPCRICNQPVQQDVEIRGHYHHVPLEEIKGAIFNFSDALREIILLEIPQFAECKEGSCPERKAIAQYLKEPSSEKEEEEEGYQPFADLK
jgi:uncharacterized metal-binding protein YceD (DUF177 family)